MRGFSSAGSGSTDKIVTAYSTHNTTRSYAAWIYRAGAGDLGRIFDKNGGAGNSEAFYYDSTLFTFYREHSTLAGIWSVTATGTVTLTHVGVSYNSGSTANDPIIYVNGTGAATEAQTPSGTPTTTANAYTIGNRASDSARVWDGWISEFGIWNAILTSGEFFQLANGVSPLLVRPDALVEYVPLNDSTVRSYKNAAPTVTGALQVPHNRILYPVSPSPYVAATAAAGGAVPYGALMGATTTISGGRTQP